MAKRVSNKKYKQKLFSWSMEKWGDCRLTQVDCVHYMLPQVTISIFADGSVKSVNILGQEVQN